MVINSFVVPTRYRSSRRRRSCSQVQLSTTSTAPGESLPRRGEEKVEEEMMIENLHSKALTFQREKKMSQAVAAYDELLSLVTPQFSQDVTFERALCLSQMGYVNEAVDGFQNAIHMKQNSGVVTDSNNPFIDSSSSSTCSGENIDHDNRPGREEIYLANILLEGRGDKLRALDIYQRCGPKSHLVLIQGNVKNNAGGKDCDKY